MSFLAGYVIQVLLIQLVEYGMICAYMIIITSYIVSRTLNYSLPDTGNASIILSAQ
jgi:hypothetical protein